MKKVLTIISMSLLSLASMVYAEDYIVVAKSGNVYDEPKAKYITVNQENEDVSVIPGMVFKTSQHTPGWYKVEYSPGLHAFIPDQIAASGLKPLKPGTYELKNNPGHKLIVEGEGSDWKGSVDGKTYKGIYYQDILVLEDDNNKIAYSIVDLGEGPIAITYDNSVTKFF